MTIWTALRPVVSCDVSARPLETELHPQKKLFPVFLCVCVTLSELFLFFSLWFVVLSSTNAVACRSKRYFGWYLPNDLQEFGNLLEVTWLPMSTCCRDQIWHYIYLAVFQSRKQECVAYNVRLQRIKTNISGLWISSATHALAIWFSRVVLKFLI